MANSLLVLVLLVAAASAARAAEAPRWLIEAAAIPTPATVGAAPAIILFHELDATLGEDGVIRRVERRAVRVLTREGREACVGSVAYRTDAGRVLDIRGWLIRPSGEVVRCGKDKVADLALSDDELYSESRMRVVMGTDAAEPGAVFGWEASIEEPALFTTFHWVFQGSPPVARSRFSLALPPGCKSRSWVFNHPALEPVAARDRLTWELSGIAAIEEEPDAPPASSLAARLAVSVSVPAGVRSQSFESWTDVARWLDGLTAPMAQPSPEVAAKARALVTGSRSRLDSVRAIGRYVQGIRYASIQMGLASGSGYRPHAPQDVLARSYGDCKDKSNLMRAMLRAVDIASHLVVVHALDPAFVREEWPTPEQFDHCIIGVDLGGAGNVGEEPIAAVADGPEGRLALFDPTDSRTPLGDLPRTEQGGAALVISPASQGLVRLPELPPEASLLERRTEVALAPDGSARGTVRERSLGQAAAGERGLVRGRSKADYRKLVEGWITRGVGGVRVTSVETADDSLTGRFALEVGFDAPRLGQMVHSQLMLFRPAMVSRQSVGSETAAERRYPVALEAHATRESAFVKLPEGFAVDELPKPVQLESPFGAYRAGCEARAGELVYVRSLTVKRTRAPAERYREVRQFFDRIRVAEQSPVVLARR